MRIIRNLLVCLVLAANSAQGVVMRPEEVERLLSAMNKPRVTHVLPDENFSGDDPDDTATPAGP